MLRLSLAREYFFLGYVEPVCVSGLALPVTALCLWYHQGLVHPLLVDFLAVFSDFNELLPDQLRVIFLILAPSSSRSCISGLVFFRLKIWFIDCVVVILDLVMRH